MALLELLSVSDEGIRVADVVRELRIPQPSASMLLRSFLDMGYVDYDSARRRYNASIRMVLLGGRMSLRSSKTAQIWLGLRALQLKMVEETIYAAVQKSARIQYVLTIKTDPTAPTHVDPARYPSITCSASGRVLLSLKPDDEIRRWIRRANAEAADHNQKVHERDFLELIAAVRTQGYACTAGNSASDVAGTAISLPSSFGGAPLAIGVGGDLRRVERRRRFIIESLLEFRDQYACNA